MSDNKKQELEVRIPEEVSPVFSNIMRALHSDDEFSLHFAQSIQGTNKAEVKAIVSLTPSHAKRVMIYPYLKRIRDRTCNRKGKSEGF